MRLVCPHCQNPIELVEGTQDEVLCPSCGSTIRLENTSTTAWSPSDGQRKLGKFELIERIGMGAFGTVYKARDPELGRWVAIKVPRSGSLAGKEDLDRFLREARSVAQLRHPSIVSVYDVGQTDDLPYLVSEFVEGLTLADLLTARRRTPKEAAELVATVADTLQYAHDHGVIHRDVKPSNILLDNDGQPHLMDFGLAKRDAGEVTMTLDGQVLGTPAYMSPEQASGEGHKVDGRSDIYSLGVILYELLTGALPFQGSTRALLHQVQHDDPPQPRSVNKAVPRDLETICLKCMRKEADQRYATARDLADDLRRLLAGEPIKARPIGAVRKTVRWLKRRREVAWMVAGAVAAVILIGVLGILFAPDERSPDVTAASPGNSNPQNALLRPPPAREDLKPLPADLDLVPRDAFAFVSVRLADLLDNLGVKRLQERIGKEIPELKPLLDKWQEEAEKKIGVFPREIERVTFVILHLPDQFNAKSVENFFFVIIKTPKPYDREKVLRTIKGGYLEREQTGRTYYLSKEPPTEAVCFVDDLIFVFGPAAGVEAFLATHPGPGVSGPLTDALSQVSEHYQIVAGLTRPATLDLIPPFLFAEYQSVLPLLEVKSAALLLRLKSLISSDPFGDTLDIDARLFYADEAKAKQGLEAAKAGLAQMQKDLSQLVQKMERESKKEIEQLEKSGMAALIPVVKWTAQFSNRFEGALSGASAQQQDRVVDLRLRLVADLPEWGVYWASFVNKFKNPTALQQEQSKAKLQKLAEAIHTYHAKQTEEHLPPHARYGPDGKPLLSWRVLILPYLDENELFRQFRLDEPWDSAHNKELLYKMPKVFRSPTDPSPNSTTTFYQVFVGKGALFEDRSGLPVDKIGKNGEKSLLIVEGGESVPWTKPQDLDYDRSGPLPKLGGAFADGFCAIFFNGERRFINVSIDDKTLRALISRTESSHVDLNNLP